MPTYYINVRFIKPRLRIYNVSAYINCVFYSKRLHNAYVTVFRESLG